MGLTTLFGLLKSSEKAIDTGCNIAETATKGVFSGLDAVWYTDEERAQATADAHKLQLKFWEQFAKENSEQSKARREIAWLLIKSFVGILFIGVFMVALGKETMLINLIKWLATLKFAWIIGSVVLTYFVPHQFSKLGMFQGKGDK